jgi:hypothetical protein
MRPAAQGDLLITHRHAAGIDVHAAEHFVAVAPEDVPAGAAKYYHGFLITCSITFIFAGGDARGNCR